MPGITGSDKAYKLALANVARAQTTRSSYFERDVVPVTIAGTTRTGVIQSSIRIDLNTGSEPHRCTFDFRGGHGVIPSAGQTVTICHGSTANRLFAGRILKVTRKAARNADTRPVYQCDAAGWLFDVNQSRVRPGFSARSLAPYSLVPYLLTVTSPNVASLGFTASKIDPSLPKVEEFTCGPAEEIGDALARLFRGVDASWYMDHNGDIRAFSTINSLPSVPSTITSAASHVWGVHYAPTELSRVFTRVDVLGALVSTVADFDPTRHESVPVDSASLIVNGTDALSGIGFAPGVEWGTSTEPWVLNNAMLASQIAYPPSEHLSAGQASVLLPSAKAANTLVVVAANVNSWSPLRPTFWYNVGGQWIYPTSIIGVFSASANSVAFAYWLHASGAGALTADVQQAADISAAWTVKVTSPTLRFSDIVPAGAPLQVMATRVNSTGVAYVSSLMGSASYGLVSRTLEDQRLGVDGAIAVASTALLRGNPSEWASLEFVTREREYEIGGPVFAAMNSPTESGGYSVAGTYTVQDMTIDGFDQLGVTKGPTRQITAGAVRRPTMWQVLQGGM